MINKQTILEEAIDLTSQIRQSDYGHPVFHFSCTASLITDYLKRKNILKDGAEILPEDWPVFMILDKVARSAEKYKRDNFTDIAGYARTREMLDEFLESKLATAVDQSTPVKILLAMDQPKCTFCHKEAHWTNVRNQPICGIECAGKHYEDPSHVSSTEGDR